MPSPDLSPLTLFGVSNRGHLAKYCMYVSSAQAARNLEATLLTNTRMLRLIGNFAKVSTLPYTFRAEAVTFDVPEQATSENVRDICAQRVLEVSRQHGEPFGLEAVSIYSVKPFRLFVLGRASEYFRDGEVIGIAGKCARMNSQADRCARDKALAMEAQDALPDGAPEAAAPKHHRIKGG